MTQPLDDVVIEEVAECHAFEFTPFGIVPMGMGGRLATGEKMNVGGAALDATHAQRAKTAPPSPAAKGRQVVQGRATLDPGKPLTGREIMQIAKARIQEIGRLLKSVPALQQERAQLQSLVLAASSQTKKRRKAEIQ